MRRAITIAALLLTATLAACGFQLRGAYNLPFKTLHTGLPEALELHALIKRSVEAGSNTLVVNDIKDAEAQMRVLDNRQEKRVLSTSASGQAREYELIRVFGFQLVNKDNRALLPPSQIVLKRDITYSDSVVLSKESEEQLLWRDMQNDLVQQLLRRLSTARLREE
jgi:LPS-assembly lipoprotein